MVETVKGMAKVGTMAITKTKGQRNLRAIVDRPLVEAPGENPYTPVVPGQVIVDRAGSYFVRIQTSASFLTEAETASMHRANQARPNIGTVPNGSAVASTASEGQRAISGWTGGPGYVTSPALVDEVMALSKKMKSNLPASGASDGGVPGRFFASHAEPQIAVQYPNQPIAVSRGMCAQCQIWFVDVARFRNTTQVVSDPTFTRVFRPGRNGYYSSAPMTCVWISVGILNRDVQDGFFIRAC